MAVKFLKYFVEKWLGTEVLENILTTCLEELVKRTDTTIDDRIFELIFKKGIEKMRNE